MSDFREPNGGKIMPEEDPRFRHLKEAIMLVSEPKEHYHIEGMFIMSVWHNPDTDDSQADFCVNPPDALPNMLHAIMEFAREAGIE